MVGLKDPARIGAITILVLLFFVANFIKFALHLLELYKYIKSIKMLPNDIRGSSNSFTILFDGRKLC